jgi:hypothetical protein
VVTKEQAEADSLRTVLRETQKQLNEAEQKAAKKDLTPPLTLEQQQAKLEKALLKKEEKAPLEYLSLDYDHTYRWFAGKEEYSGQIFNSATFAAFMNIDIRITFLSKTKTALGSKVFTVYEYCFPGSSCDFKIQTTAPRGYTYHEVEIIRALPHDKGSEYEPNEQ